MPPPCGLDTDVYERALRIVVRIVKGKQPLNASNALRTATKGMVSVASRNLKAIALQMQRAGIIMLVTTRTRCSPVRTLVMVLVPVGEEAFTARDFLHKLDVTVAQWNARCAVDAPLSSRLDAPRRSRGLRRATVKEERDIKVEPRDSDSEVWPLQ